MKQKINSLFSYSLDSRKIDKLVCPRCKYNKFHESMHGHGHTLHQDMVEKEGYRPAGFGDYSLKCQQCKIEFTYVVQMFVPVNIRLQDIPVKEWNEHFLTETKIIIHKKCEDG